MTKPNKRIWVPRGNDRFGSVRQWTWTRRDGLQVTYTDGLTMKSDWRTLPEFLKAVTEKRESAVEVINGERTDGLPLPYGVEL